MATIMIAAGIGFLVGALFGMILTSVLASSRSNINEFDDKK